MSTLSIPSTAKTLLYDVATQKVQLVQHPTPTVTVDSTEHLIRAHAAALCAGELSWLSNFPSGNPDKEPVPAYDVAGTVIISPLGSPFKPGDAVYTRTNYFRTGCAREYAIVLTEELGRVPGHLTWEEAASVPLSAMTAWQALFVQSGIGELHDKSWQGKRVLVTAASGAVGNWIVQLATLAGAEVIATCGPKNVDFVKNLGAKVVLNYRDIGIKEWFQSDSVRQVDVVIDCVGNTPLEESWYAVKSGGIFMSIVQPPNQKRPSDVDIPDVRNFFFIMQPDGRQMSYISQLLEEGKVHPVVDSVWTLEEHEDAFERLNSGHARGKVVFKIAD
ncbi:alcohol dehydrogenase [Patellaria atrata CBS 101060]|uniref:Alcohol dehydrogenase n=1 Tax=Patellaria atrata CBS 101060 TaxID=1346257 RepID=A0A9P4SHG3_9PEZI|nr:alcohol dehydrogenase [Patellaria atrata CBS 101060]